MTFKYRKEIILGSITLILCLSIFSYIKVSFFNDDNIDEPIKNVINYYNEDYEEPTLVQATTVPTTTSLSLMTEGILKKDEELLGNVNKVEESEYPYSIAPTFEDDGSIVWEGMTLTELTDKLNKSLKGYMVNTGYFFAKFTKDTGLDPYLAVSIVLLETGCKWTCSTYTRECNNIGGLKGNPSCNGTSYRKYDTLGEGIEGFLNIIYKNYFLKGLVTPEQMNPKYAASSEWAKKVRTYMEEIKNK